ncbi:MAG: GNAT family N-acetyltransferase [Chloroflexota bacterium]
MTQIQVRQALVSDRQAIPGVILAAFGDAQGGGIVDLVFDLLEDESAQPLLSLVAAVDDRVIGHILFTSARIQPPVREAPSSILAPLAVHPNYQGQGMGGLLIEAGLERLRALEVGLVFVLGHPGYYPRHGFSPAGMQGFDAPYPIPPGDADAWMVQELRPGIIGRVSGRVACARALDDPRHWQE